MNNILSSTTTTTSGILSSGVLSVKLLNGSDLIGFRSHRVDPYCELKIGNVAVRSARIKKNTNPYWNETFSFQIADPTTESLVISVYDHDTFKKDKTLGYCVIPLNKLVRGQPTLQSFPLMNSQGGGSITVELTAKDFGLPATQQPSAFNQTYPQYQAQFSKPLTQSAPPPFGPTLGIPPKTF